MPPPIDGIVHASSSNINIPVAAASLHVVEPATDGAFGNLLTKQPDLIVPFAVSCVIINIHPTNTIFLRPAVGESTEFVLGPESVVEVILRGSSGGIPVYLYSELSTLGAGRDFLRGVRDVDPDSDVVEEPEAPICAVYRLSPCLGLGDTLYTAQNLNIYTGRSICIEDESDVGYTCYFVDRVPYEEQTLVSGLVITAVHVTCDAANDNLPEPYNCEDCVYQYCSAYAVMSVCADNGSLGACFCNTIPGLYFDGDFRDFAYFASVYGAGDLCSYRQVVTVESCNGDPSTCTQCCWCFDNGVFCDQSRADLGCEAQCCANTAGICTCAF